MEYAPAIGLEIHAELKTASKMFCSCFNKPDAAVPNTNVCPVCLGHPGTMPVANEQAIRLTRMVGLAFNSRILEYSKFDRKNYFYPDLPKGYQISQYDLPLCSGGYLDVDEGKRIRITRVHLEEDTAKLVHPAGETASLVDFNRSGVPLMELVTEPDMENAAQVREFVEELQLILRYLRASDADMEKGKLRVEVNISLAPKNGNEPKKLGTKVEIKNLNSLKAVEGAVAFEIKRQSGILAGGGKIVQETRGWDDTKSETCSQREKEEAFDYRYFPEPDIPPLIINQEDIKKLKAGICELPRQKRLRFQREYGLDPQTAEIFVTNRQLGGYLEETASELENWLADEEMESKAPDRRKFDLARLCANYLATDVQGLLKGMVFSRETFKPGAEDFAEFIGLIYKKEISSKIAKTVLAQMVQSGGDPTNIIANCGLAQINDEKQIAAIIDEVIKTNPKAIQDYRNGKQNAFQFLVGQVLGRTQGKANPDIVKELLLKRLAENA